MEAKGKTESNRGLVIALAVLVVVMVGLVVGIIVARLNNNGTGEVSEGESSSGEDEVARLERIERGKEEIMAETDEALARANTDEEKGIVYSNRAGELYNLTIGGDELKKEILASAYEAETLAPTAMTAYNIYVYESSYGDTQKAEEYLIIAKERGISEIPGGG